MANVVYFGNLSKKTNTKSDEFDAKTIKQLLNMIEKKYGRDVYKMAKASSILVNEQNAGNINGYSTKLANADIVKFLPICGGG